MNAILALRDRLMGKLTDAQIEVDAPGDRDAGTWWLDIKRDGAHVAVEWNRARPDLGVSPLGSHTRYGEPSGEWFSSVEAATTRVVELVGSGRGKVSRAG